MNKNDEDFEYDKRVDFRPDESNDWDEEFSDDF